jgi:DnaK suppressor protein
MEKQLLEKFKTRLEDEKREILKELSRIAVQNKEDPNKWEGKYAASDSETGHDGSELMADESEEHEQRQSIANSLSQKLSDINLALDKIAKGTYGRCENCGHETPYERLDAFPAAGVCLDCRDGLNGSKNKSL